MFLYTKGILRLFYRFLNQRPVKTLRTIFFLRRLLATIWVEANRVKLHNLVKLIGENKDLLIESKILRRNL